MAPPLLVAKTATTDLHLLPALANRHGLITGATGTGKTVTLQTIAHGFSAIGVPVFLADVKGDLTGLAQAGGDNPRVTERARSLGLELACEACPVALWDVFGRSGHPVRATVSDMGPLLLARMLGLNDTQEGVLTLVFRIADDAGLLLLDVKDLRAMLQHVGDNARQFTTRYGTVATASIGAIQRRLLALESQGAGHFFGEPMLDIGDFMQARGGRGVVNILAADRLLEAPQLYATFLLWMLAELFEHLPEVGDPEKPRLVFFFDEAHLLFAEAPRALLARIEQVVRLIRSKGVGVFFVTQNPLDIPDAVLGQLGNRVQHALRAFTLRDQRAVKAAADTMRPNPRLRLDEAITELGVGEALVSFLDAQGRPGVTERALIVPPGSRIGPIPDAERAALIAASPLAGHYDAPLDRESAHEVLARRAAAGAAAEPAPGRGSAADALSEVLFGRTGPRGGRPSRGVIDAMATSAARAIGSELGRRVLRGMLGSILGGKR